MIVLSIDAMASVLANFQTLLKDDDEDTDNSSERETRKITMQSSYNYMDQEAFI